MNTSTKKGKGLGEYMPLAFAAGIGSMLGSGIIVGLSATIVVGRKALDSIPRRSACFPVF